MSFPFTEGETEVCFRENKGLINATKPVNGSARMLSVMPYIIKHHCHYHWQAYPCKEFTVSKFKIQFKNEIRLDNKNLLLMILHT